MDIGQHYIPKYCIVCGRVLQLLENWDYESMELYSMPFQVILYLYLSFLFRILCSFKQSWWKNAILIYYYILKWGAWLCQSHVKWIRDSRNGQKCQHIWLFMRLVSTSPKEKRNSLFTVQKWTATDSRLLSSRAPARLVCRRAWNF